MCTSTVDSKLPEPSQPAISIGLFTVVLSPMATAVVVDTGSQTVAGGNTVQPNVTSAVRPPLSVTVAVTSYEPSVLGVPEIRPDASIASPGGRPVADQV